MTIKELKIQNALGLLDIDDLIALILGRIRWDSLDTYKELLIYLSDHEDWLIRSKVAINYSTPIKILNKLLTDESWIVRCNALTTIRIRKRESIEQNSTNN